MVTLSAPCADRPVESSAINRIAMLTANLVPAPAPLVSFRPIVFISPPPSFASPPLSQAMPCDRSEGGPTQNKLVANQARLDWWLGQDEDSWVGYFLVQVPN